MILGSVIFSICCCYSRSTGKDLQTCQDSLHQANCILIIALGILIQLVKSVTWPDCGCPKKFLLSNRLFIRIMLFIYSVLRTLSADKTFGVQYFLNMWIQSVMPSLPPAYQPQCSKDSVSQQSQLPANMPTENCNTQQSFALAHSLLPDYWLFARVLCFVNNYYSCYFRSVLVCSQLMPSLFLMPLLDNCLFCLLFVCLL